MEPFLPKDSISAIAGNALKSRREILFTAVGTLLSGSLLSACGIRRLEPGSSLTDSQGGNPAARGITGSWQPLSLEIAGLKPSIQLDSENSIWARIGDQVCLWNGTAWSPVSDALPELQNAFFAANANLMCAKVGGTVSNICVWDPTNGWVDLTLSDPDLGDAFHFVSADLIYARIGNQICKWNAGAWTPLTSNVAGLQDSFQFVSESLVYAVVSAQGINQICRWSSGAGWIAVTDGLEELTTAFHVVTETEIYAVIGEQICIWDGTQWSPYTPEISGLKPQMVFADADNIYAVVGEQVCRWSAT